MKQPLQIVVTGAECSGKSTLTRALAASFQEPWVEEYAVEYLRSLNRTCHSRDLVEIARRQLENVEMKLKLASRLLPIDTGLEVIKIWHRDKIGPLPQPIHMMDEKWSPALYLLCRPDVPYEPGPFREDPNRREELFQKYRELLSDGPTVEVYGDLEQRMKLANEAISKLL